MIVNRAGAFVRMNLLSKLRLDTGIGPIRWWDTLSALLLVCALLTAATRLVVTRWTEDLYLTQTIVFIGVVLGLMMGQSRFSSRVVILLSLGYLAVIIPWQLSLTIGGDMAYKQRLVILMERLLSTADELLQSKPVTDNIMFLFLMGLLFCALSLHAGYSLTRYGQPWRSVLPTGLALMVIHSYDPFVARRAWFLAAYLLFGLMLVARLTYIQRRALWKTNHTHMPPDVGFDWIRFTLVIVVGLTLLAWTVPALASTLPAASNLWQYVRQPWVSFQNHMSNAFSSLKSSVAMVNDYYGDSFNLGRGSALSDSTVFSVKAPALNFPGGRLYWRAYAYDTYQSGQWKSTIQNNQEVTPGNFNLVLPQYDGRTNVSFIFVPYIPIATFYTASQPEWISLPAKAFSGLTPDGTSDLVALQAQPAIVAGQNYQEKASLATMTVAQLQAAGTDYPQWIKDHYLQVPDNITPRTRQLAEQLASGKSNPYDIAAAVTDYLRTYTYSEVIDPRPANQEVLDWWLFDYRKGFCQYYASAEVILLRSAGIPARMAVGYAEGEFVPIQAKSKAGEVNPENPADTPGTYVVRQKDAHAWPEVYFPKYGWVEFEPTAGQQPLYRPLGTENNSPNIPSLDNTLNDHGPIRLPGDNNPDQATSGIAAVVALLRRFIIPISITLFALALLGMALFMRKKNIHIDLNPVPIHLERSFVRIGLKPPRFLQRWAQYARLSPVSKSYLEINRALSRLGNPPAIKDTPAERAVSLVQLVPATTEPTRNLLSEYQFSMYSTRQADEQAAQEAGKEIRKLSYLALLQRFISRFQNPSRRNRRW